MKDKQTPYYTNEFEFIDWVTKQVGELIQREQNLEKVIFDVKAENKALKDENKILKAIYADAIKRYSNAYL